MKFVPNILDKRINEHVKSFRFPSRMYHIAPSNVLPSIKKRGLRKGALGVYLTSDIHEILKQDDIFSRDNNFFKLTVNTKGLPLRFDPEFYTDYSSTNEVVKTIKNDETAIYCYAPMDIPKERILKVEKL